MKTLNGLELVDFIKVRQLKQVRGLRQAEKIIPKLAIIKANDNNPVIETYVRHKMAYADDILVEVEVYNCPAGEMPACIKNLAADANVHGIIVQLPLPDDYNTNETLHLIPANKDVDGLNNGNFTPATPMAINWLLAGYNVDVAGLKIAIVGRGRLVGAPLEQLWREAGHNIEVFEKGDGKDLASELPKYDLIITATGVAGLIKPGMVKPGAVVVDAGTSSEKGVIKGDVADEVRARTDITITPKTGGVGPLTVAALFDNVILSARRQAEAKKSTL